MSEADLLQKVKLYDGVHTTKRDVVERDLSFHA